VNNPGGTHLDKVVRLSLTGHQPTLIPQPHENHNFCRLPATNKKQQNLSGGDTNTFVLGKQRPKEGYKFHTGTRVVAPVRRLGYGMDGPEYAPRLGTKFPHPPCGIQGVSVGVVNILGGGSMDPVNKFI